MALLERITLVDAWRDAAARDFFRNVWPMYVHEISGFDTDFYALDDHGRWQPDIVEDWIAGATPPQNLREARAAQDPAQPFQRTFVIQSERRPVGFVAIGLPPFKYMRDDVDVSLAELFVIHAARGGGAAAAAIELLLPRHPGRWHLRVIHDNARAIGFWRNTLPKAGARSIEERNEEGDLTFSFLR